MHVTVIDGSGSHGNHGRRKRDREKATLLDSDREF
jgi:hypothetical protein